MVYLDLAKLRARLKEKGITQKELAYALNKNESHINRKLNGWISMSVEEALTIFDISHEDINDYKI